MLRLRMTALTGDSFGYFSLLTQKNGKRSRKREPAGRTEASQP